MHNNPNLGQKEIKKYKLFEAYCRLCSHQNWQVRKSCCSLLPTISSKTPSQVKKKDIVSIYNSFLSDESVEVQIEAKCIIGPLVHSYYPDSEVPAVMLDYIIDLCPSPLGTLRHPVVVLERLAYCFPAIVLAFGKDNWSKLNTPFQRMVKLPNLEITKPIAYGMHEIARIISPSSCTIDLYPIILEMLRGPKELKLGILSNLYILLASFSAEFLQSEFGQIFEAITCNSSSDWSIRESISKQLGNLSQIFKNELQQKQLLLQLITLCNDQIGIVREVAFSSLVKFLQSCESRNSFLPLIEGLKETKFKYSFNIFEQLFKQ